jgi:hypothetical protein
MEGTGDDNVEMDPHLEWSSENVATFVRSLGTAECFQSVGDQVMQIGVDDSVQVLHIIPQRLASRVDVLLSKDDRSLSEAEVKTWVDNYKASLNRKKKSEKDTDPKDKDQE